MKVQNMEYIIAIAEEKSLSRAALRLNISQPALSHYLKGIETELGTPLFTRAHNEMQPTDAGRIYINGAYSIVGIYHRALTDMQQYRHKARQELRIMYNNSYLPALATRVLPAFRQQHPGVTIKVLDGNAEVAKDYLTNGQIDLGIFATRTLTHSILEYIPLFRDEMQLILPPGHPSAAAFARKGIDFEAILEDTIILNQPRSYVRQLENEILSHNGYTPSAILEASDYNTARYMISHGLGVGFLPRSLTRGGSDNLRCYSLQPQAYFHTVIGSHKGMTLSKEARDFIRLVLQAVDGMEHE